jgi:hypothetical protein
MRRFEIMPSAFLTSFDERPKLNDGGHETRRLQTAMARRR